MERNDDSLAAPSKRSIKLFLAGDVMTGRGIDQALPRASDPVLYESYVRDARQYVDLASRASGPVPAPLAYDYVWGDAVAIWQQHQPDLRIANLETSITTSDDAWPGKGIHYRMHPGNVACLSTAQFDCCTLANNHVLDWGHVGLEQTLATLRSAGIATTGAGIDRQAAMRPARLGVSGTHRVLVFAVADVSSGVPRAWQATRDGGGVDLLDNLDTNVADCLATRIGKTRQPDDIVIVSIHWGNNWGYRVPEDQRRFARRLIDSGNVDIVFGHSSHHPKAIEYYGKRLILYGCGDFLNDYEGIGGHERFRPWLSAMYFVTIDAHTHHVERVEIEAMRLHRFRLQYADLEDVRWLRGRLDTNGESLGTRFEVSDRTLVAVPQKLRAAVGSKYGQWR